MDHQWHPARGVLTSASQVSSVTGPAVTLAGAARTITRRGVRTAQLCVDDAGARAAQREWATDSAIFQNSKFSDNKHNVPAVCREQPNIATAYTLTLYHPNTPSRNSS